MHCCIVLSPFISLHLCCIFSKRREQEGGEREREAGSKIKRVKDVWRWCAFWRHAKCATTNNNNKMQKISTTNKKKEGEGEKNKGLCITFRKRKIDYSTLYYASITVCVTHSLILHTHTLSLSLHSFCVFLQAIPLSPQQQQLTREEGTPKTNDDDNKNAAQKEARPVSRVAYVCGCVCVCM